MHNFWRGHEPAKLTCDDLEGHQDPRTHIVLDIEQRTERVMIQRTRWCGRCGVSLEPTQMLRKHGFPGDPGLFLRFIGVVLGPIAWLALKAAYRAERGKHWRLKMHAAQHPIKRARSTWMPICDGKGHRIDKGRVTDQLHEVTCNWCKAQPRFRELWLRYREMGKPWAQRDPEEPPVDLAELEDWS